MRCHLFRGNARCDLLRVPGWQNGRGSGSNWQARREWRWKSFLPWVHSCHEVQKVICLWLLQPLFFLSLNIFICSTKLSSLYFEKNIRNSFPFIHEGALLLFAKPHSISTSKEVYCFFISILHSFTRILREYLDLLYSRNFQCIDNRSCMWGIYISNEWIWQIVESLDPLNRLSVYLDQSLMTSKLSEKTPKLP